ncbi:MAG: hypothetical protein WCG04_07330 [Alphaproteobacteria bacterium]
MMTRTSPSVIASKAKQSRNSYTDLKVAPGLLRFARNDGWW